MNSSSPEDEARVAAIQLVEAVNKMSFDYNAFASEIGASHRTLQQGVMRAFLACVKLWCEDYNGGYYDLRNEDTVKLSAEIVGHFGDKLYLRYV